MTEIKITRRTIPERLAYLAGKLREGDGHREAAALALEVLAGEMTDAGEPDIQYFGADGTWIRPERAAAIDVLVQAGGGGAAPGVNGADGELAVKRFYAPEIPPTMDIQIGKGGRPGGRDGYVLVVTHLTSEEGGQR